jgi:hypothetical protein
MNSPLLPAAQGEVSFLGRWTVVSGETESTHSVPLGHTTAGHLDFRRGISQLRLRAGEGMTELFQSRFRGTPPSLEADDGHVMVRYRHSSFFDWMRMAFVDGEPGGSIALNSAIPWQISIRGGLSELRADLSMLDLTGFRVIGGACDAEVRLPKPAGVVPIRIEGGASNLTFLRPEGSAARLRVMGGVSQLRLDTQVFGAIGGRAEIVSPGFDSPADYYDIQITGGVSNISVETQ